LKTCEDKHAYENHAQIYLKEVANSSRKNGLPKHA